jgi:hypothetical protein
MEVRHKKLWRLGAITMAGVCCSARVVRTRIWRPMACCGVGGAFENGSSSLPSLCGSPTSWSRHRRGT